MMKRPGGEAGSGGGGGVLRDVTAASVNAADHGDYKRQKVVNGEVQGGEGMVKV